MLTCDICKEKCDVLVTLRNEFKEKDIEAICEPCDGVISEALQAASRVFIRRENLTRASIWKRFKVWGRELIQVDPVEED